MRLHVLQPRVSVHGRQVGLSLLVILVSHLLLMISPLHDLVLLGHLPSHETMEAHSVHAVTAECVGPVANDGGTGADCVLHGATPPRSGPGSLHPSTPPGRLEPPALAGLLPAPPARSIWPPPLSDPQVLFQVFRL